MTSQNLRSESIKKNVEQLIILHDPLYRKTIIQNSEPLKLSIKLPHVSSPGD